MKKSAKPVVTLSENKGGITKVATRLLTVITPQGLESVEL